MILVLLLQVSMASLIFHYCILSTFVVRIIDVAMGFPGGLNSKESTCNARDMGSVPGSGKSHGGGHGNPLQYSCLENPRDRGTWQATVHGVPKSQHD